ncbi:hypothetical protein [Halorhabdus amylolytica]|uniref:hypothetical protein n=1 Tax=Halorhabdus amylolytica TaxID=2559573 RepID=UPI0010AB32ED|nr:hypothetical protein [Halorhabdus amylolytica]
MTSTSILDRYRRPEYTGENRCLPCTAVNAVFALSIGMSVFVGLIMLGRSPWVASGVEAVVLIACGVQIWLRGYLIPGTPTLTKRYLPRRVLRWFGKDPTFQGRGTMPIEGASRSDRTASDGSSGSAATVPEESELDVEGFLLGVDALRPAGAGEDFEVVESFAENWRREIDALEEESLSGAVTSAFHVDGAVSVRETSEAVQVYRDDRLLAQWESRPALVADLAACRVLAERDDAWGGLSAAERSRLAGGLRLYLDRCPACGGETAFDTETTTSCCHEYEVATVSCEDCGTRLFELPVDAVPETDAAA